MRIFFPCSIIQSLESQAESMCTIFFRFASLLMLSWIEAIIQSSQLWFNILIDKLSSNSFNIFPKRFSAFHLPFQLAVASVNSLLAYAKLKLCHHRVIYVSVNCRNALYIGTNIHTDFDAVHWLGFPLIFPISMIPFLIAYLSYNEELLSKSWMCFVVSFN